MSLRINTNVAAFGVQTAMAKTERELENSMKSLSSGNRFSQISTDPADKAISEDLKSDIAGMDVARRNAEQAGSFAAVAEGGMAEQTNLIVRMRELAVQAASDTYSDTERSFMQTEFEKLQQEVDRIAMTSAFGSRKLLDGTSQDIDIQVGTNGDANSRITFNADTDTTLAGLGLGGTTVAEKSDARDALEALDEGLNRISMQRSKYGALQSRLESTSNFLAASIESVSGANSKLADTDLAKEVSNLRKNQVLQQYQSALLNTANEQVGIALRLIG
ncbi:flagellin [Pseudobdellovibrio sp. HCB154]|uniref:flagellin n=1 Tax=Pseudobdellovibrio sp. HCB154 TaxID=3386277 RepID=UPI0039175F00